MAPLRTTSAAPAREALAAQGRRCLTAAEAATGVGSFTLGAEKSRQALAIGQTLADTALQAAALSSLALQALRLGDGEAAVIDAHRALALLRRTRDTVLRGRTLCTLVLAYLCIGLQKDALLYASQALEVAHEAGDDALLSWAFNRAGSAHKALGEPLQAQALFEQSLRLARRSGGREEIFAALNNLSGNFLALAASVPDAERMPVLAEALQHANEALKLAQVNGLGLQQATCHSILARTHVARGDHEQAQSHAVTALEIATRHSYRLIAMSALLHRGAIERHRGNLERSIEFYNQVLVQARGSDDHDWVKEAHQGLAESYRRRNDAGQALEHLEASRLLERRQLDQRADAQVRVLLNRREFDGSLPDDAESAPVCRRRQVPGTCIAVIAPDDAELLRERHGPAAFARMRDALGGLVAENARSTDFVAHLDGVAYVVGHADTTPDMAAAVCERLRATIKSHDWGAIAARLGVTVTIAVCEVGDDPRVDPIDRAVHAMQAAQQRGRDQVTRAD